MGQDGPLLWPGVSREQAGGGSLPQCAASFIVFFLIELELIYTVVLISAIQQSDSVIRICIQFFLIFLSIMVYPRMWHIVQGFPSPQSSLCYIGGPCCLSILYVIVCILLTPSSQPISPPAPSPLAITSLLSTSLSLFLFWR